MTDLHKLVEDKLSIQGKEYEFFSLPKLGQLLSKELESLPFSLRILLEGCLRNLEQRGFRMDALEALAGWQPITSSTRQPVPFMPARILLQDFTGLPVLNDLTGLRAALARRGKKTRSANPKIPCDLVIDHSITVDAHGCPQARQVNEEKEFNLNFERYQFLKWSEQAYSNLRVFPPGLGICHQINLEYLSQVIFIEKRNGVLTIYPDSVLGTDSHTPMINGLGVLGWGVGGIEALAAMLGYASEFPIPDVVGVELTGKLQEGVTPTDLTLNFTKKLREYGVVGKFVEVFGDALRHLPLETRAMMANMSPESGATVTYFPVDSQVLSYLERTGRDGLQTALVEAYFKAQSLFRERKSPLPEFTQVIRFDLSAVEPTVAGPKRPQDTICLSQISAEFHQMLTTGRGLQGFGLEVGAEDRVFHLSLNGDQMQVPQGAVLIAAITSCTNTSDPYVMIAAGLLARNAATKGLNPKPWVKTSFAPGSRVVESYLHNAGLLGSLEKLGFNIVGYGCTTCIGNSGPIDASLSKLVQEEGLISAAVLSGNRNFEGRIHPDIRAAFLASPPLVIAFALAGRIGFDFSAEPLGADEDGNPVFLQDIYPSSNEITTTMRASIHADMYRKNYRNLEKGNLRWNAMPAPQGEIFPWSKNSTLILEPFFLYESNVEEIKKDITGAYALLVLGDSVTTDHISPAGRISPDSPAGRYLHQLGVPPSDFISFGARRGNHEVMVRGTFSNPRLNNFLVPKVEGGITRYLPADEVMPIYEAAQKYKEDHIPLLILAGKAYGSGSSRDWAAKGTFLLGVRAIIAESYERIHRANLICMGILPLQYPPGESAKSLGLSGEEKFTIQGSGKIESLKPQLRVAAEKRDGRIINFPVTALINTPLELEYIKAGGLGHKVLDDFLST